MNVTWTMDDFEALSGDWEDRFIRGQRRKAGPGSTYVTDWREIQRRERAVGQSVSRVDLAVTDDGALIARDYASGWVPGDRPVLVRRLAQEWTLEMAADAMEFRGWTVRRWPGGARCWRCGARGVRSREKAARYRDHLRRDGRPDIVAALPHLNLLLDL